MTKALNVPQIPDSQVGCSSHCQGKTIKPYVEKKGKRGNQLMCLLKTLSWLMISGNINEKKPQCFIEKLGGYWA